MFRMMIRISCFDGVADPGQSGAGADRVFGRCGGHNPTGKARGRPRFISARTRCALIRAGDPREVAVGHFRSQERELDRSDAQAAHVHGDALDDDGEPRHVSFLPEPAMPENACADWLKLDDEQRRHLPQSGQRDGERAQHRQVRGHQREGRSRRGVVRFRSCGFPVKWDGKNGGGEMQNIQEGPQPASLFEIPAGYTKMDMGGMMQQQ